MRKRPRRLLSVRDERAGIECCYWMQSPSAGSCGGRQPRFVCVRTGCIIRAHNWNQAIRTVYSGAVRSQHFALYYICSAWFGRFSVFAVHWSVAGRCARSFLEHRKISKPHRRVSSIAHRSHTQFFTFQLLFSIREKYTVPISFKCSSCLFCADNRKYCVRVLVFVRSRSGFIDVVAAVAVASRCSVMPAWVLVRYLFPVRCGEFKRFFSINYRKLHMCMSRIWARLLCLCAAMRSIGSAGLVGYRSVSGDAPRCNKYWTDATKHTLCANMRALLYLCMICGRAAFLAHQSEWLARMCNANVDWGLPK